MRDTRIGVSGRRYLNYFLELERQKRLRSEKCGEVKAEGRRRCDQSNFLIGSVGKMWEVDRRD